MQEADGSPASGQAGQEALEYLRARRRRHQGLIACVITVVVVVAAVVVNVFGYWPF